MLRLALSKFSKSVPTGTRTLHNTSMDAVKLAEVRDNVHTESKKSEPTLHISALPMSKISVEIKAAKDREAARARAIANDLEFREVHGKVRDIPSTPAFIFSSPTLPQPLASINAVGSSTADTQIRFIPTSATRATVDPSFYTPAMKLKAHQKSICERVEAGLKSGRCVADLDSAFGL